MADHLEEYFLHKTQLAAAEKGWEEALIREKELRKQLVALLIQMGGQAALSWDTLEAVRGDETVTVKEIDCSTPSERAVRLELQKAS